MVLAVVLQVAAYVNCSLENTLQLTVFVSTANIDRRRNRRIQKPGAIKLIKTLQVGCRAKSDVEHAISKRAFLG
ncbi:hypothetical protein JB92DRAFT_3008434, partial [Gautieria morchelliformis]